jgi:hypothetical protein
MGQSWQRATCAGELSLRTARGLANCRPGDACRFPAPGEQKFARIHLAGEYRLFA